MRPSVPCAALTLTVVFWASSALAVPTPGPEAACASCETWSQPSGQGVALGVDVFGAPTALEWDLSVVVPVSWLFAVRGRPVLYAGLHGTGAAVGGKVEAVFRSKLLLNFMRVYAGGGPAVFYGLSGPNAREVDGNWFAGEIDGNWFAGAEVFFHPRWALHWELGTSGGAFSTGAGPYTDVGLSAYLF